MFRLAIYHYRTVCIGLCVSLFCYFLLLGVRQYLLGPVFPDFCLNKWIWMYLLTDFRRMKSHYSEHSESSAVGWPVRHGDFYFAVISNIVPLLFKLLETGAGC